VGYEDLPRVAAERDTLIAFLDWQRETLAWKCEGLSDDQLRRRSVPPSTLSLLGLIRHAADVERSWFRRTLAGESTPSRFSSESDPDGDFDNVATADVAEAFAAWREECDTARQIVAARDLEATGRHRTGREVSLRWILNHVIEEYSRHNGHADLLRQCIDATVGYSRDNP
jgi:uncharacterized damage-inducible protein DinB